MRSGDIQNVSAKYFVLAMGSSPIELPGFTFDEENILSSTGALAFQEFLKKLLLLVVVTLVWRLQVTYVI